MRGAGVDDWTLGEQSRWDDDASAEELLAFTRADHGGCVVLRAVGEVDSLTGPLFRDHVTGVIDGASAAVVLDLRDVDFFGSAGISSLVLARDTAARRGVPLRILCTGRVVLMPLRATGLLEKFDVYDDLAAATA